MDNFVILAQITSIIGWLLLVYSYYKDDIDKLLFIQIISSIFYCISYFFLGAWSGLLVCFIELLKGIGYYKTDSDNLIFLISLPVYIFMAMFTYNGFLSLLPIIGSIIDGFSLTKNKTIATAGSFISNVLWVIYDIGILAYTAAATDAILVISNLFILIFGYSSILKVRKLRFVYARNFNWSLYNSIYKLDKKNYGDEYTWSYEYEKNINNVGDDLLFLIKYHNDVVGYLNCLVVNEDEYIRILNSNEIVKQYNIENITKFKKNRKNYLIIESINIKSEFQKSDAIKLIIKKIKNIIITKYNKEYKIESIVSTSINKFEEKVLEEAGFSIHKEYSKKEKLYIIDNKTIEQNYLTNVKKKSDYKIFDGENITEEMLNSILLLDKKFFKDEYLWNLEYQKQLFNKNKNSLIIVTYKNKVIGYLNYLVITKEKYDEMLNSDIIIDDFSLDDVLYFYKSKKNYITINSVVIEKKFQNGYPIKLLTRRLKRNLKKLYKSNYKIGGINAFAVSDDGRKLLDNLGFEKLKDLSDNNSLFVLENDDLKNYLK